MSLKNMEFITEYIYFHQTYINIQLPRFIIIDN